MVYNLKCYITTTLTYFIIYCDDGVKYENEKVPNKRMLCRIQSRLQHLLFVLKDIQKYIEIYM